MIDNYKDTIFQTQKGSCTNKLTAAVKASQDLCKLNPENNMEREKAQGHAPNWGAIGNW